MDITKQFIMSDGGYAKSEKDWVNPNARDVANEVSELVETYVNSIPSGTNVNTEITISVNIAYKQTTQ